MQIKKKSIESLEIPLSIQHLLEKIVSSAKPKQIVLFGSRATGKHRENSDFDLCVLDKNCSDNDWNALFVDIQTESFSLYKIDLVEFDSLNKEYQDQILKEGKILYERSS